MAQNEALASALAVLPAAAVRDHDGARALADPDLLVLVLRGEISALAEIYDRHIEAAWKVALHFSASAAAAEQAVTAAFLHVWTNPAPADQTGLLARLLRSVTREARASHLALTGHG